MEPYRMTQTGKVIILFVVLFLLLCVLGGFLLNSWNNAYNLNVHLGDYVNQNHLHKAPFGTLPYIAGKVVPIEIGANPSIYHPIYDDLPSQWKANSPSDVQTVVWVSCTTRPEPTTYNGFYNICVLTVVDWTKALILGQSPTFQGPLGCAGCIDHPVVLPSADDMVHYITDLPTKPPLSTSSCPYKTPKVYDDTVRNISITISVPQGCYMILSIERGSYISPDQKLIHSGSLLAYQGPVTIEVSLLGGGGLDGFFHEADAKAFYCKTLHSGNIYGVIWMPNALNWYSTCRIPLNS